MQAHRLRTACPPAQVLPSQELGSLACKLMLLFAAPDLQRVYFRRPSIGPLGLGLGQVVEEAKVIGLVRARLG
jgi:hypothetical protein